MSYQPTLPNNWMLVRFVFFRYRPIPPPTKVCNAMPCSELCSKPPIPSENQFFPDIKWSALNASEFRVEAVVPVLFERLESKLAPAFQRSRRYAVLAAKLYWVD